MFKGLVFSVLIFYSSFLFSQSKIIGEELKLVFSEYFVDPSDNFPRTGKADAKFWATYGDGYYYMEHKINGYTAIMAKQPKTKPDFAIKCKLMLGPSDNISQSVGVLFAMNNGGKNALIFEFNRKKEFRVRDLQGNVISDSWVKSKLLKPAEIYQKIEIKCYNYFYEIYVQDKLIFSFSDDRFEGGRYGVIIGPLSLAKMDYYNVYDLTIPGKPSTIPVKKLVERIDSLEKQNENLRKELIEKKFNTKDQNMVEIMHTMEKRIEVLMQENKELKTIVTDYENNSVTSATNDTKSETDLNTQKLNAVTTERDELKRKLEQLELKLNNTKNEQDKVNISPNSKDGIIKEEKVEKKMAKNAKEIKVEESNLSEKIEKVDELRSTKNKTESKEELVKQNNDIKIQEPIFKPSENNQEKYFPEIDELRVPVKKSSIKQ